MASKEGQSLRLKHCGKSEQDEALSQLLAEKNQFAKVKVVGQETAFFCIGKVDEVGIGCRWRHFGGPRHVNPLGSQPLDKRGLDICIGQQFHGAAGVSSQTVLSNER